MPKPDIISSNQPRSVDSSGISTPDKRLDDASISSSDQVEILKESFQRLAIALEKSSHNAIAEVKLPHVSEQIDLAKRDDIPPLVAVTHVESVDDFQEISNQGYNPVTDELEAKENDTQTHLNKDADYVVEEVMPEHVTVTPTATIRKHLCDMSSGSSTEVEEIADNNIHRNQERTANDDSKNKSKTANGSVFKPVWRTPSTKQQQNPTLLGRPENADENGYNAESQVGVKIDLKQYFLSCGESPGCSVGSFVHLFQSINIDS